MDIIEVQTRLNRVRAMLRRSRNTDIDDSVLKAIVELTNCVGELAAEIDRLEGRIREAGH